MIHKILKIKKKKKYEIQKEKNAKKHNNVTLFLIQTRAVQRTR